MGILFESVIKFDIRKTPGPQANIHGMDTGMLAPGPEFPEPLWPTIAKRSLAAFLHFCELAASCPPASPSPAQAASQMGVTPAVCNENNPSWISRRQRRCII